MIRFAPVYRGDLVLDPVLRREGRTLYGAGAFVTIPDKEIPLLVDHDPDRQIGTVRELFKYENVDGRWHAALVDITDPPPWLARRTPVSFSFIALSRSHLDGCKTVTRALVREVSIVSSALQPLEPGARVLTLDRTDTGPVGEVPADGQLLIRPRIGAITGRITAQPWLPTASGTVTGAAALTGTGSSTTAGTHDAYGAAFLIGNGTLSTNGTETRFGAAALTGLGSSTTAGTRTRFGAAALSGTGTLTASGSVSYTGAAHLTGTGTLTATAADTTRRRGGRTLIYRPEVVLPKKEYAEAALQGHGWLRSDGTVSDDHPRAHLTGFGWIEARGGKPITDKQLIEELETLLLTL